MSKPFKGVSREQERAAFQLLRDTRRGSEKLLLGLKQPYTNAGLCLALSVLALAAPPLAHFVPPALLLLFLIWLNARREDVLPIRMPVESNCIDYNDPQPGINRGYKKASGIFYLGNDSEDGLKEIHLSKEDMLRHLLVLGTTGSGKTETLTSIAANSITMGGGLIYVDAKGSPGLVWNIAAIARSMGREDDLLVINYITGNKNIAEGDPARLTNTTNPFALGSADSLTNILTSLIPSPEGDNAIFGERAISLLSAIMWPLTELRDKGILQLGPSTIREFMNFEKFVGLSKRKDLSDKSRLAVSEYLNSLPGYKADAKELPDEVTRQFGFAQMYFTRALASLSDTYGHIYWTTLGEVDFYDVVMNRRILVVMLPAMEKSGAELKNLGKIILSGIRDAMSAGLGNVLEGWYEDVHENLPTASNIPTVAICDEYGYMATEGFAVTAAQARGLGFSCTFAGQDWPGIKRGGEEEAGQIWGNTNTKYFGTLIDQESMDMAVKAAGEAYVTMSSGYAMSKEGLSSAYLDNRSASIEKRERISGQDLQAQTEGEFHLTFRGRVIRGHVFYANPPKLKYFELNRFLKVAPRTEKDLLRLNKGIPSVPDDNERPSPVHPEPPAAPEPPPADTKAEGESGSLFDRYKHIFDEESGGVNADNARDMGAELGAELGAMGGDFMDEAARIETALLADQGGDIQRKLADDAALIGVIDDVLEYPTEAVEAVSAKGSKDKSEAVDLLNAEIMKLSEGP